MVMLLGVSETDSTQIEKASLLYRHQRRGIGALPLRLEDVAFGAGAVPAASQRDRHRFGLHQKAVAVGQIQCLPTDSPKLSEFRTC